MDVRLLSGLSAPLAPGAPLAIRNLVLEDGSEISLDLKRFEPFTADAKLVVHGASGDTASPLTSDPYFIGIVSGDPQSFVFLAGGQSPRGLISAGGKLIILGPETDAYRDGAGETRLHTATGAELDVPESMRGWRCGTESLPEPPMSAEMRRALATRRPLSSTVYYASVAVETDYEFYSHFGSVAGSKQYVADLFAAASAIYLRDVKVILQVNYLSLWTTAADPWNAGDSSSALNEFTSYWQTNRTAVPRSTAHFLSMRGLGGGIGYLSVICGFGYALSGNLAGAFSTTNPGLYWDIMVVTHEIGHNFSSPHTHCYSPPVDMCYNECYPCPCSVPPELGTIMSYCHLLSGGYSNLKMFLGVPGEPSQAVLTKVRTYVETSFISSCLGTVPGPSISTVTPPVGTSAGGTPLTITGANFVSGATVTVGGVPATGVNVASASTITATTGAHAAALVDVMVKNPDNQAFTAASAYTYSSAAPPPTVGAISPNNGSTLGSTPVTITGTGFVAALTVTIGGVSAAVGTVTATSISATTGAHVTGTVGVTVTNPDTQTNTLPSSYFYVPPPSASQFFTLTPCRILDTRGANGPYGGPALNGNGSRRAFVLAGQCNVPAGAKSVSANVTITGPAAGGSLTLFPGNGIPTGTSSINFSAGQTRANNAMLLLSTDGTGSIIVENDSAGITHFILDVNGYLQ